ncbi:MAG: hypothetical protein WAO19_06630 [Candidatus Kryptoniota bacterium]
MNYSLTKSHFKEPFGVASFAMFSDAREAFLASIMMRRTSYSRAPFSATCSILMSERLFESARRKL